MADVIKATDSPSLEKQPRAARSAASRCLFTVIVYPFLRTIAIPGLLEKASGLLTPMSHHDTGVGDTPIEGFTTLSPRGRITSPDSAFFISLESIFGQDGRVTERDADDIPHGLNERIAHAHA